MNSQYQAPLWSGSGTHEHDLEPPASAFDSARAADPAIPDDCFRPRPRRPGWLQGCCTAKTPALGRACARVGHPCRPSWPSFLLELSKTRIAYPDVPVAAKTARGMLSRGAWHAFTRPRERPWVSMRAPSRLSPHRVPFRARPGDHMPCSLAEGRTCALSARRDRE